MRKTYSLAALCMVALFVAAISGCTSTGNLKCPDLAGRRTHTPLFAKAGHTSPHIKADKSVVTADAGKKDEKITPPTKAKPKFLALLDGSAPFQAKLPDSYMKDVNQDQFAKVNTALAKYSANKVSLMRNEKGKVYLKADSRKEFVKLTRTLMHERKSSSAMSDEARDILALVAGICGIVSIAASPIPYFDFISFPTGIAGIVLGVLGLRSDRRHKWALLGIILGAVGITLAILFTIIYFAFVFGVWAI